MLEGEKYKTCWNCWSWKDFRISKLDQEKKLVLMWFISVQQNDLPVFNGKPEDIIVWQNKFNGSNKNEIVINASSSFSPPHWSLLFLCYKTIIIFAGKKCWKCYWSIEGVRAWDCQSDTKKHSRCTAYKG